ncbi:MAG: helix-turn-helix transcriptional regulator [Planctomycetes bacterium]|nr:helix-turn-helix transcriptional regulator [Planctomycetota bacterium]
MTLGAELRRARKISGMSQEKLAFAAELDRSYVSMIERDISSPTVFTLMRICKALRVRASEIIQRIESQNAKRQN